MNTLVSEVSVRTETLVATVLHKAIKRNVPTAKLPYTWYIDCAYKDEQGIEFVVTAWHNAKPEPKLKCGDVVTLTITKKGADGSPLVSLPRDCAE